MFDEPLDLTFADALALRRIKVLIPSNLTSRDWANVSAALKEQASFSASVDNAEILSAFDKLTDSILNASDRARMPNPTRSKTK
jgi:hypothetical protein